MKKQQHYVDKGKPTVKLSSSGETPSNQRRTIKLLAPNQDSNSEKTKKKPLRIKKSGASKDKRKISASNNTTNEFIDSEFSVFIKKEIEIQRESHSNDFFNRSIYIYGKARDNFKKYDRPFADLLKQKQLHNKKKSSKKQVKINLPQRGKDWCVPSLALKMIFVERGAFQMGSPNSEESREEEEYLHMVSLTDDFWIGQFEVTQEQFRDIMGTNPSEFKNSDHPVESMSLEDAMDFCSRVTAREKSAGRLPLGYSYNLPTEAQWEFAARGGNSSRGYKYSGSNNLDKVGWYDENTENTQPVGKKKPNELKLYDMSGNVNELCLDCYDEDYYLQSPDSDPLSTISTLGISRTARGGSWNRGDHCCRSAYRLGIDTSRPYLGFRIVLTRIPL